MSASCTDGSTPASRDFHPLSRRMAAWLAIAAAPTFAAMAIMTIVTPDTGIDAMCGSDRWSLTGMTPMYLLMCLFHTSPWLQMMNHRWTRGV